MTTTAPTSAERERYPLVGQDTKILEGIHTMESIENLSEDERFFLLFLRTQLEENWRQPCLELLKIWKEHTKEPPAERWKKLRKIKKSWWNPAEL